MVLFVFPGLVVHLENGSSFGRHKCSYSYLFPVILLSARLFLGCIVFTCFAVTCSWISRHCAGFQGRKCGHEKASRGWSTGHLKGWPRNYTTTEIHNRADLEMAAQYDAWESR